MTDRIKFDNSLKELESKYYDMSEKIINIYDDLLEAITNLDSDIAEGIIEGDKFINELESDINEHSIELICMQAPVATDLRRIMTALKVASDLERIGDYAVNGAKFVKQMNYLSDENKAELKELILMIRTMLSDVLRALESVNVDHAKEVAESDNKLDVRYREILHSEFSKINLINEDVVERYMNFVLLLKQLERAGDHITNIAEHIVYLKTSKNYDLN